MHHNFTLSDLQVCQHTKIFQYRKVNLLTGIVQNFCFNISLNDFLSRLKECTNLKKAEINEIHF